jgi:hypothetical protein
MPPAGIEPAHAFKKAPVSSAKTTSPSQIGPLRAPFRQSLRQSRTVLFSSPPATGRVRWVSLWSSSKQTVVWWYGFQFVPTSVHQQDLVTASGSY